MKFKRILVVFAILAVVFSLTGCSDSTPVDFEYSESGVVKSVEDTLTKMVNYTDEEALYYQNKADEVYATGVLGCQNAKKECGAFKQFDSYKLTEKGDNLSIVFKATYEKRTVKFDCTVVQNPEYAYDKEVSPLMFSSIVVTPEYSFGEQMEKAGANTLMGMGTVFIVLIFISILISFFKYIPRLFSGKAAKKAENSKKEAQEAVKKTAPAAPTVAENLMDDSELVAVITAAINAYESANGATSKDTLVVRSISRARR